MAVRVSLGDRGCGVDMVFFVNTGEGDNVLQKNKGEMGEVFVHLLLFCCSLHKIGSEKN